MSLKNVMTEKGQTMARALPRTRLTAQQLVVMLRTLRPVVTHMGRRQTDFGGPTPVETRTSVCITVFLILMARTVVNTIATDKYGQAIVFVRAPEVCLRTHNRFAIVARLQRSSDYVSGPFKRYKDWWSYRKSPVHLQRRTSVFIVAIHTLLDVVTRRRFFHAL